MHACSPWQSTHERQTSWRALPCHNVTAAEWMMTVWWNKCYDLNADETAVRFIIPWWVTCIWECCRVSIEQKNIKNGKKRKRINISRCKGICKAKGKTECPKKIVKGWQGKIIPTSAFYHARGREWERGERGSNVTHEVCNVVMLDRQMYDNSRLYVIVYARVAW